MAGCSASSAPVRELPLPTHEDVCNNKTHTAQDVGKPEPSHAAGWLGSARAMGSSWQFFKILPSPCDLLVLLSGVHPREAETSVCTNTHECLWPRGSRSAEAGSGSDVHELECPSAGGWTRCGSSGHWAATGRQGEEQSAGAQCRGPCDPLYAERPEHTNLGRDSWSPWPGRWGRGLSFGGNESVQRSVVVTVAQICKYVKPLSGTLEIGQLYGT